MELHPECHTARRDHWKLLSIRWTLTELIGRLSFFWNEFVVPSVLPSQEDAVRRKLSQIFLVGGLALLVLAAVPARAAKDVVHFGNSIDVAPGESIHDAVCFFCSVNVKGTVKGDLVVFFGDVRIDGQADHDVVNFFGDVKVADNMAIGHNLVNFFGGVELGQDATVGQDAVVMLGRMREADTSSVGGSKVVESGMLFWIPFLVIAGMVSFGVREVRWMRRRRLVRGY
jgi:hypothetical protein